MTTRGSRKHITSNPVVQLSFNVMILIFLKGGRKMKKFFRVGVVLLVILGSVALVFAGINETQRERGGSDLQNVHDRILCVDGFKVFQTIKAVLTFYWIEEHRRQPPFHLLNCNPFV